MNKGLFFIVVCLTIAFSIAWNGSGQATHDQPEITTASQHNHAIDNSTAQIALDFTFYVGVEMYLYDSILKQSQGVSCKNSHSGFSPIATRWPRVLK